MKIKSDSDCKIIQVRYYRHQAPKKYSVYCFVEREKMDEILTELNLETLAAVFQGEIIAPSIVQSMSNEKIETTI